MKSLFASLVLLLPILCSAQKSPVKFGDIALEDMKMTVYAKDSSAEAVVLVDFGESELRYNQTTGFQLEFERTRRIKILSKEGLKWADFSIPLYRNNTDEEKISGLKAVTYNLENGKIVETKAKTESIFKEKYDDNLNFTKVTWPNVKVGSVLEITYRIISDFVFNFQDWEFQNTIPTVWSEYRVKIPEYYNYEKYMQGYVPLFINENSTANSSISLASLSENRLGGTSRVSNDRLDFIENKNRWVAKDVAAFKDEPFMTTSKDFISKMNFELSFTKFPNAPIKNYMGSWEDINKSYQERLGEEISGNNFLKNKVEELTAGKNSTEEKISAIFSFVRSSILWDGQIRKYPAHTLRKVFDEKKGSSAEINLLLASMLEKADIKASPVLISTRDHGFVREATPVSSQFNNVVCLAKWNDKSILLDATDKFLSIGMLPERCLNGRGFVVSNDGYEWINLTPNSKAKTNVSADLMLGEEDQLKGKLKIERSGHHSISARKAFFTKGKENYTKDLIGSRPWSIIKSEFQNENDAQQPFKEIYDLNVSDHFTIAGNTYYFNPFIANRQDSNPFKDEKRNYPVDFGAPFDNTYFIKITLPAEYTIDEMPKSKVLALPGNGARYLYNIAQVGNTIAITSTLSINRGIFSQEEYPNLREFYNQMVAKQAEQIVFKKKQ